MVDTFFKRSCTIHPLRQGPLAGHIDLLADLFATDGFLGSTAESNFSSLAISTVGSTRKVSVRIKSTNLSSSAIAVISSVESESVLFDMGALMRLLQLLREQGITPRHAIETVPTPREALLEKYRCYLREERGLAQGMARIVLPFVDRFLAQRFPRHHFDFTA